MTTTVPPGKYVSRLAVPVNERRVITSEWLKLTTLRSSWITMALGIGALAFLGGVIGFFAATLRPYSHQTSCCTPSAV